MQLTKDQITLITQQIDEVCNGDSGYGYVLIEIGRRHVRRVYAASGITFPVPEEKDHQQTAE